jgi:DNA-binding transcriptional LysR family regulator
MDLRLIEMFQAVMRYRSVTEAARSLGVSQPAVSAALGRLEKDVGFALFRREGRHIAPTPEALLLDEEAARALAGFAQLEDAAAGISAGRRGTLTIATNPTPGISWLPPVISRFRRERPAVNVRLLTRSSNNVRSMVSARAFDLGLAEPPFDRSDAVLRRYRFRLQCVLPADHALAAQDEITPALLEGQDLIVTSQSRVSYGAVARAFHTSGALFQPVIECEFIAIALNLVIHGAGICLADPISIIEAGQHFGSGRSLVARRFAPKIIYEVALLRPAIGELSRLAAELAADLDKFLTPHLAPR